MRFQGHFLVLNTAFSKNMWQEPWCSFDISFDLIFLHGIIWYGLIWFDSFDISHLPIGIFEVSQPSSISQEESEGGRMMTINPTTRISDQFWAVCSFRSFARMAVEAKCLVYLGGKVPVELMWKIISKNAWDLSIFMKRNAIKAWEVSKGCCFSLRSKSVLFIVVGHDVFQ